MCETRIRLGRFSREQLDEILQKSSEMDSISDRIGYLSGRFLGVDYAESTLSGGKDLPETLVVNLEGVDCFTFIDYIEAMRMSHSFADFLRHLISTRYISEDVSFVSRKHFFTDWTSYLPASVADITGEIGGDRTCTAVKALNMKEDGSGYLQGIEPRRREIFYIPGSAIDDRTVFKMATGDYIGIYSDMAGIDVSHVGIFIREREQTFFRHASSRKAVRKVVDEDFLSYVGNAPGIIVFRPV